MNPEQVARDALALDGPLELLRASGSTVYRSTAGIVRVAPGGSELVRVARLLHAAGAPVAALLAGPIELDGVIVTLWEELPDDGSLDGVAIGRALRRFHEAGVGIAAPAWDPIAWLDRWIGVPADPGVAREVRDRVRASVKRIGGPIVLLHTDAHRGNLRIAGGEAWLVDLEQVAVGPASYDLAALEVTERRFRGDSTVVNTVMEAYRCDTRCLARAVASRGFATVRDGPGLAPAVAVREALAVGFVLGLGHVGVARERLAQLDDPGARWAAF